MDAGNDLDKWKLRDGALRQRQTHPDADDEALYQRAMRTGSLPPGLAGLVEHERLMDALPPILERGEQLIDGAEERGIDVDLPIDGTRILGRIDGIRGDSGPRVVLSVSSVKSEKYHLRLWINHVVRRAFEEDGPPAPSHLVARDGTTKANRVNLGDTMTPDAAKVYLKTLLHYFRIGQQAPLLFFPKTSFKYASGLLSKSLPKTLDRDDPVAVQAYRSNKAIDSARKAWDDTRSERDDHHLMLWGERRPVDPDFTLPGVAPDLFVPFATLAVSIWGPFLDEKERSK